VHAQKSSPMLSHTEIRAARRRARSQGSLTLEKTRLPGEVASRSRRSGSSVTAKKVEYENRIRLITEDDAADDLMADAGSVAVRDWTRRQQRFAKRLEEKEDSTPHSVWLSLDASSGEVTLYSHAAATRLETGYVNNRTSVPLAGLGDGLDDDIVHMAAKGSGEHPVQRSLNGSEKEVRRIQAPASTKQITVNLIFEEDAWRFAAVAVPGKTEARHILLHWTEMVRPNSKPLPPLNPDRRLNFCNVGAYSGAE